MPVCELHKVLIATFRHAHNERVPRRKGKDRRGQVSGMLTIHVGPPAIEDRQFPEALGGRPDEGRSNASALETLVERTSRVVKLPEFKPRRGIARLEHGAQGSRLIATDLHCSAKALYERRYYARGEAESRSEKRN